MRKLFSTFCATLLAIAASAQTAGGISPSSMNVYTPDVYEYVSVTYSDSLTLSSAVATVSYGDSVRTLTPDSVSNKALRALFNITPAVVSLGVPEGGVITVSAGSGANATAVSANYKYYTTVPVPTANPAAGYTFAAKDTTVVFTFASPMVCQSINYASGTAYNSVERDSVLTSSVTASILESYWGSASLTVSLDGLKDAEGYTYPTYYATYYCADNTVNYLGVTADPTVYTYQAVYDELWYVGFKFDKQVVKPESGYPAKVSFYRNRLSKLADVDVEDYDVSVEMIDSTTNYVVNVLIPEVPSAASAYTYAVVQLQGFTYGGSLISQPSETYYATLASSTNAAKAGGLSGIQTSVADADSTTANVYNLQGVLVKSASSNLNGLAKGVYIVGGKKVVVK